MKKEFQISATDFARSLSDVLNRVHYRRERFVIVRGGEPIADLVAHQPEQGVYPHDLVKLLADVPLPGDGFAKTLEDIRAAQGEVPDRWPS